MSNLRLDRTEFLKFSRQIRTMTAKSWRESMVRRLGGHIKPGGRPTGKRFMARARRSTWTRRECWGNAYILLSDAEKKKIMDRCTNTDKETDAGTNQC